MSLELVVFAIASGLAIVSALAMVVVKTPVRSVISLVVTFFALAVFSILLAAPFIAALQVIVYAGAILVLFLFVIMLLNLQPGGSGRPAYLSIAKGLGTLASVYVFYAILRGSGAVGPTAGAAVDGSVRNIGTYRMQPIDGDSVRFVLDPAVNVGEGTYAITLAAGSMEKKNSGPVGSWTMTTRIVP